MPKEIDRHEVQRLVEQGAQLVDVLPASEYEHSHLPGALSIPLADIPDKAPGLLDRTRPVVAYCYDALCDMSPRAAWRLESLGFGEVYDYVASKVDWLGAGLAFEGALADQPRLVTLADPAVPTCQLDDASGDVRARLDGWGFCLVVNDQRVVLGLARAEALGAADDRRVGEVMREAPRTYRPHVTAAELAPQLTKNPRPWVLVTNLNGTLVGAVRPEQVHRAAGG